MKIYISSRLENVLREADVVIKEMEATIKEYPNDVNKVRLMLKNIHYDDFVLTSRAKMKEG